jgi:magnesium transporter
VDTLEPSSSVAPEPLRLRAELLTDGRCRALPPEEAVQAIHRGESTVWLDVLVADFEAAQRLLGDELGFHELAIEDALSDMERPTLQEYGDSAFLSVPVPFHDGQRLKTTEIGIFLVNRAVVTVSTKQLDILDTWFKRWREHPTRIGDHPAHVAYVLIDAVVDSYFPILDKLEDQTDDLTEAILNGETKELAEIMQVKRSLLEMRRALAPLRDVVNSLLRRDLPHIPEDAKPYFQDIFDHVLRLSELVETNREALTGLLDIHLSKVSHSLNEVMKKMTVLSTVLMSMALIAGIYGMNFRIMPELGWPYGYPYALGLMAVSAIVILFVFRRVKWL